MCVGTERLVAQVKAGFYTIARSLRSLPSLQKKLERSLRPWLLSGFHMITTIAEKIENDLEDLDKTTSCSRHFLNSRWRQSIAKFMLQACCFLVVALPRSLIILFSFCSKILPHAVLVFWTFCRCLRETYQTFRQLLSSNWPSWTYYCNLLKTGHISIGNAVLHP